MSDRESHAMNCAFRANTDEPCTCAVSQRLALETECAMHAEWWKRAEKAEIRVVELEQALAVMADELADFHRAEAKYNTAKNYFSDAEFDGGSLWLCARTQANTIAAAQLRLAAERWNLGAPPDLPKTNICAKCSKATKLGMIRRPDGSWVCQWCRS